MAEAPSLQLCGRQTQRLQQMQGEEGAAEIKSVDGAFSYRGAIQQSVAKGSKGRSERHRGEDVWYMKAVDSSDE